MTVVMVVTGLVVAGALVNAVWMLRRPHRSAVDSENAARVARQRERVKEGWL